MLIISAGYHFTSEWARLARSEALQTLPFLDRSVFRAGQPPLTLKPSSLDDHPEYKNMPLLLGQLDNSGERKKKFTMTMLRITKSQVEPLLFGQLDNSGERKKKFTMTMLRITNSQVEHLTKMANDNNKPMARGFTRFETICGHIWRIACRAWELRKEQPTSLAICVDSRNRMRPKLPREYFGNATFNVITQSVVGDLMSKPLGFAASKIREAIENVTSEYVMSSIKLLKKQKGLTKFQDIHEEKGRFYGNPNIQVESWLTLPIEVYDFWWGKEEYMGLGSHGTEGNTVLLPNPEGDGSIVVDI